MPLGDELYVSIFSWSLHGDLISISVRIIKRRKKPRMFREKHSKLSNLANFIYADVSEKEAGGKKARIGKLNTQTQTSQLSRIWRETHAFGFTLTLSRSYL